MSTFWQDRPTFLTGATGLVGGWLLAGLHERGAKVVCLVRDWVPRAESVRTGLLENVTVVRGDVRDQALLERALGEYEIDTVFHLAAQTIVTIANRNPVSTFETNIGGTWSLLEAARRSPSVEQVVLASSDKAYGQQEQLPYTEESPLQGRFPYDVSKSCADLVAQCYAQTYDLPTIISRCGNFFGGGDLNWNRLVPGTIRSALRGESPLIRSDGKAVRDYFYVEDGRDAYLLLAERLAEDPALAGKAFNFSAGRPRTVREMAERILELTDADLELTIANTARNEIPSQHLDASEARRQLGWEPRYSLDEALSKTIDWYRDWLRSEAR